MRQLNIAFLCGTQYRLLLDGEAWIFILWTLQRILIATASIAGLHWLALELFAMFKWSPILGSMLLDPLLSSAILDLVGRLPLVINFSTLKSWEEPVLLSHCHDVLLSWWPTVLLSYILSCYPTVLLSESLWVSHYPSVSFILVGIQSTYTSPTP